jgi:hypothetical protein
VPSALTVTTLNDTGVSGDGSLRGEIMAAGNGDTIQFAPTLKGGTIKLNSMLDINKPLTIDGANNGITVSGGNQHVVFTIEPGFAVGINGLTITGGFTVGAGAGINNNGSLTLTNSTVTGNSSQNSDGAGIENGSFGTIIMSGDAVTNNTAGGDGGGIDNNGTLTIINCTIAGNGAGNSHFGGGINNGGVLRMANSTVAFNTVQTGGNGGGIYHNGSELDLLNTIVFNPNSAGPDKDVFGNITQAQGDLFGSLFAGAIQKDLGGNQLNKDPQLGPLQNNGGPTATMAMLPGSLAIGKGAGTSLILNLSVPTTDQRGAPRPANSIDIGAFQTQAPPAVTSAGSTTFTLGAAGTFTVTTAGFPAPSLTESGALPNGMQFIDNGNGTATLTGTPTGAGQFPITITATNGVLPNATQTFTLTVLPVPSAGQHPIITPGVYDTTQHTAFLKNAFAAGAPDSTVPAGNGTMVAVAGDWDGTGVFTVSFFDTATATWTIRHANGAPNTVFAYGSPGDTPVAGDWNGSGKWGIGIFRPALGLWQLRAETSPGAPDVGSFLYGSPGSAPVVGDWDGDGKFGIGVVEAGGVWKLKNAISEGEPDYTFAYGADGDKFVAGDWDGTGTWTPGVLEPHGGVSVWKLRDSNSAGAPDVTPFAYGSTAVIPLAGDWDFPALL